MSSTSTTATGRAKKKTSRASARKTPAKKAGSKKTKKKKTAAPVPAAKATASGKPAVRKKTARKSASAGASAPSAPRRTDPLAALATQVDDALTRSGRAEADPTAPAPVAPGPGLHYAVCMDRVRTATRLLMERFRNGNRAA